ncbi:LLM class F420-dependent oxidoreductase [Gryllotalpicola ginsengisoli]|uniref:LLM class F420-dependent oxidoreductase n=1 Tax=Gryllotalpicola ginsengisoli TaxID=444608 RepID=UPI0003B455A4|nr:LLM class F420-dependent oxidoreductase [Gryllotalpicola ginsengisoli]
MSDDREETTPEIGRYGVWQGRPPLTPEPAYHLENLGFGAIWVGHSPAADLRHVESLIANTSTITVATAIANIWTADPRELAAAYHRVEAAHPGRLLLGIGAGHPETQGQQARKPYAATVEYLDVLDAEGVPASRRVLAALGPRMLELARDRAAGAHPYLVTPSFNEGARDILGPAKLLATEQRVVLRTDPAEARDLGRPTVDRPYLGLRNYLNNLRRLGYGDDDLESPGSDRLIDDLVVSGDAAAIKARVDQHLHHGADHVAVQLIVADGDDRAAAFAELAADLGLSHP